MKAILDTNVALSLWHFNDTQTQQYLSAAPTTVTLLGTAQMRAELAAVLQYPHIANYRNSRGAEACLAQWDKYIMLCEVAPKQTQLTTRDKADQPFLDLLIAEQAQLLLTLDKDLLSCARRAKALQYRILTPKAFYEQSPLPSAG